MDIEQLKLILATLHDAGTGAMIFGICYLAKDVVMALVICGSLGFVVIRAVRLIADSDAACAVADEITSRIAAKVGAYKPFAHTECARMHQWITDAEAAIAAVKAEKK